MDAIRLHESQCAKGELLDQNATTAYDFGPLSLNLDVEHDRRQIVIRYSCRKPSHYFQQWQRRHRWPWQMNKRMSKRDVERRAARLVDQLVQMTLGRRAYFVHRWFGVKTRIEIMGPFLPAGSEAMRCIITVPIDEDFDQIHDRLCRHIERQWDHLERDRHLQNRRVRELSCCESSPNLLHHFALYHGLRRYYWTWEECESAARWLETEPPMTDPTNEQDPLAPAPPFLGLPLDRWDKKFQSVSDEARMLDDRKREQQAARRDAREARMAELWEGADPLRPGGESPAMRAARDLLIRMYRSEFGR